MNKINSSTYMNPEGFTLADLRTIVSDSVSLDGESVVMLTVPGYSGWDARGGIQVQES